MKRHSLLKLLLFGLISGSIYPSFGQAVRCENAHGDVALELFKQKYFKSAFGTGSLAKQAIEALESLNAEVLSGRKTPTWMDFESLSLVKRNLENGMRQIREAEGENGVQRFYQELDAAYLKFNRKRQLQNAGQLPLNLKYGPVDFGLRSAFRAELEKLNRLLPSQMRFGLAPLPKDINKDELRKQGEQVVQSLEEEMRKLYSTSGYKNVQELVDTIDRKGTPRVKENLQELLNEDFEFAIARPENARWWVPKVGFHNQFVTGSSKGYKGTLVRNALEASKLSVNLRDYEYQDNDLKPKYGWLIPKLDSGHLRVDAPYGDDYFILDKEKLRRRTTWTPSDSLNPVSLWFQGLISGNVGTPTQWEHLFVPWSQRALLAPLIKDGPEKPVVTKYPDAIDSQNRRFGYKVGPGAPDLVRPFFQNEYIELQYWGPVTLDDVKIFIFKLDPPSGEFLAELLKRKISIYEIVSPNEYKLWTAGASK